MWLVNLNYNFECDWLIELSDNKLSNNKLSDNNLESELVENGSFCKPITIEEIVIFMIRRVKTRPDTEFSKALVPFLFDITNVNWITATPITQHSGTV